VALNQAAELRRRGHDVTISENVCISQEVLLCTGSHDRRSPTFEFDNGPITVEDAAWVAARATVLRGVRIGPGATIGASALVVADVPEGRTIFNTGQDGR
jgi:putative colanic acid biosynthesis acetyltransferase WcaF